MRRPLLMTGAAIALIGASAAGYAKAGDSVINLAATFSAPTTAAQADAGNTELLALKSSRENAARASALRASGAADQARAAVAAQAAAIAAQRQAETDRAARDLQRVTAAQADPKAAARSMLAGQGWNDGQWSCLERLWVGESNWSYTAANPSGAYGIPQALPGSKMASAGADYRTNPITQITWGMDYIKRSYGSPCSALATWNSRSPHWY